MRPKFRPPEMIRNSWVTVQGVEHEVDIELEYEDQSAEVVAAWFEDQGNVACDMTDEELAEANMRLTEYVNMLAAEWEEEYGDYLYEQAKDRRLGL